MLLHIAGLSRRIIWRNSASGNPRSGKTAQLSSIWLWLAVIIAAASSIFSRLRLNCISMLFCFAIICHHVFALLLFQAALPTPPLRLNPTPPKLPRDHVEGPPRDGQHLLARCGARQKAVAARQRGADLGGSAYGGTAGVPRGGRRPVVAWEWLVG